MKTEDQFQVNEQQYSDEVEALEKELVVARAEDEKRHADVAVLQKSGRSTEDLPQPRPESRSCEWKIWVKH